MNDDTNLIVRPATEFMERMMYADYYFRRSIYYSMSAGGIILITTVLGFISKGISSDVAFLGGNVTGVFMVIPIVLQGWPIKHPGDIQPRYMYRVLVAGYLSMWGILSWHGFMMVVRVWVLWNAR